MAETKPKFKQGDIVSISGADGKPLNARVTADPWLTPSGWMYKCREQNDTAHLLLETGIQPGTTGKTPAPATGGPAV